MASSPIDTHLASTLVPVLCPGAAVRHSGDPNAHGVVVSVVNGQATVLWSVVPSPPPAFQSPRLHNGRWTDDQVEVALRDFDVDLRDPDVVEVDVQTTHTGEAVLVVHRIDDTVRSFARSPHEDRIPQRGLTKTYHRRRGW